MIPSFTSLMSTIAGKVAAGLVVATASVGAAAAAGAPVPLVTHTDEPAAEVAESEEQQLTAVQDVEEQESPEGGSTADDPDEEPAAEEPAAEDAEDPIGDETNHGEMVSSFVHDTDLEGCEKGQATAAVARGLLDPSSATFDDDVRAYLDESGKCTDEDDATDEESTEEADDPTHGEIVSTFVHETELTGCEKGQATAAVARGDIQPGDDGSIDPAAVEEYLSGLDTCRGDDDDAESEAVDAEDGGKQGKPEHAGQRGADRSQGKAKGHDK